MVVVVDILKFVYGSSDTMKVSYFVQLYDFIKESFFFLKIISRFSHREDNEKQLSIKEAIVRRAGLQIYNMRGHRFHLSSASLL